MNQFANVPESKYDELVAESARHIRILDVLAYDQQIRIGQGKWGNRSRHIIRGMFHLLNYLLFVMLGSFLGVLIMLIWRAVE